MEVVGEGDDRVCHHDEVGLIEPEVVTHEHLQTTVRVIYKDVILSILVEIMLALSVCLCLCLFSYI